MRIEKDFLGQIEIPTNALYGIHSLRARENFPDSETFSRAWYQAIACTKLAIYRATLELQNEIKKQYPQKDLPIHLPKKENLNSLIQAAEELSVGKHFEHFIVPAISGGAGTSFNMNVNEIIANRALELQNKKIGDYTSLDPIEDANIFQSTNDVIPTALRVAILKQMILLEEKINTSRLSFEKLENRYRQSLRLSYTQMQAAIPSSFGNLFGPYQEALSRDWWRLSKIQERLKVINLGGSAIGTGMTIPQFIIFKASEELRAITSLPLARAEQPCDATMNLDPLVESHAILKAHAVNLEKITSDLRLLGSDLFHERALKIPPRQVGSSIMPGKVNPVICEYIISISHLIYANDQIITSLSAQGCLELNAYLPLIGHTFLKSIEKLTNANDVLQKYLLADLQIDEEKSKEHLFRSSSLTTALVPYLGYHQASLLAKEMQEHQLTIYEANQKLKLLAQEKLEELLTPANLLRLGFKISDLLK